MANVGVAPEARPSASEVEISSPQTARPKKPVEIVSRPTQVRTPSNSIKAPIVPPSN